MKKINYYDLEPIILTEDSSEDTSEGEPEILEDSEG